MLFQRKPLPAQEAAAASSQGWTIDTLKTYVLAVIASNEIKYSERYEASQIAMQTALVAQKLAVDTALGAADRAVTKADLATEKRFENVNEFRAQLKDQATNFVNVNEFQVTRDQTAATLTSLREQLSRCITRDEFTAAKDQAANSMKSLGDKSSLNVSKLEFDVVREQFVTVQRTNASLQATYVTREDITIIRTALEKSIENLSKEIAGLRESRSEGTGKSAGANALYGYLVGVAGIVLALVFHFVK